MCDDLMNEPLEGMRRLDEWLGDRLTPTMERAMAVWLAANPQRKHRGHSYSLADFGISPTLVREQFGSYMPSFGF
jgi:hypothetical protein